VALESHARLIATDSGGIQREAYFLGIPCLTLRDETEWIETVEVGWNKLVGTDPARVIEAWFTFTPPVEHPPIFGDGTAGQRIVQIIEENLVEPVEGLLEQNYPDYGNLISSARGVKL
jgi:UDP-N-acetylglucosamine 2-epimerase